MIPRSPGPAAAIRASLPACFHADAADDVTASTGRNPWIGHRTERPDARVRLFCFPYAGGGASIYRGWAAELPADVEVLAVQPPGREGRIREPLLRDMGPMIDALDAGLADELDAGPHAFFGYSLGALTAYELARRRRDSGGGEPLHLIVAAHSAPQIPWQDEPLWDLPSDRFRERLRELQGTPAEVLDHPELMELVEPMLRADFHLNETYVHRPGPPLGCPITAFGGLADGDVPREELAAWGERTRGRFEVRMVSGGHFFLHEPAASTELLRTLGALLGGV